MKVDQYETKYKYRLSASDYELMPKIDPTSRDSKCSLALWNLEDAIGEQSEKTNEFALGQNFIRRYNMTMRFVRRTTSQQQIALSVFIGKAQHYDELIDTGIWVTCSAISLLGYLSWFTVLKYKRVRLEQR